MASFIKDLELDKEDLKNRVIVIKEEDGIDANFCISCLMCHCLSVSGNGLLLIATHHCFNHYYHVGMKLGFNLTSQNKRALVIELSEALNGKSEGSLFGNIGIFDEESLKNLFIGIRNNLEYFKKEHSHVYLFIDNMSSFLFLGYSPRQLKIFFHYLRTLATDNVTVVIMIQTSTEDDDELEVASFMWHVADIRLCVSPLRTGSSDAVSGSIELSKRDFSKIELWSKPTLLHYKLYERNIKIFHPGNI